MQRCAEATDSGRPEAAVRAALRLVFGSSRGHEGEVFRDAVDEGDDGGGDGGAAVVEIAGAVEKEVSEETCCSSCCCTCCCNGFLSDARGSLCAIAM